MSTARAALTIIAWGFLGLLTVQVFLAGVGLFGAGSLDLHREFGYWISGVPLLMLVAAALGRAARLAWLSAGLLVLAFVQTSLPYFRGDLPFIAALHPVNALVLFWLTHRIARAAMTLTRASRHEREPGPEHPASRPI